MDQDAPLKVAAAINYFTLIQLSLIDYLDTQRTFTTI